MYFKSMFLISSVLILVMATGTAVAQLAVAEELLVDLNAEDLAYGEGVATWPNSGTLGDFTANGSPVVEDVDGFKAVTFDGASWFDGPTTTPGIEGAGTRTIEVWVYNPAMPGEETMVSWAHRGGPEGSNMAFNYGNDSRWGSVGHWGGGTHDMGWWTNHSPAPAANTWWHIVYTYDGTGARIYVNGELESTRDPIGLDTHGGNIIRIGAQADNTGDGVAGQFNFTGSIAVVRVHDGTLNQADIQNNFKLGRLKAWSPEPADGSIHEDTWANLSWTAGGFAVSHDVYVGDNYEDVEAGTGGTFRGNQMLPFIVIGFAGFPFPDGLIPGKTYYWRVDEINEQHADSPWKGDVWSFTVPPKKAYAPVPADGAKFVSTDVELTWTGGFGAKLHYVYFSDNYADVEAGAPDTYKGPAGGTTFTPGVLEMGKKYYWRVDEFDAFETHTGDVWSLTTIPVISVTDPNLVGWWKLDEGQGANVIDWSGQGNHGTLVGGATWIDAYDGDGVKLDGSDDYINLPIGSVISSLSSATFTSWVNFANAGGAWQRIFDFGSGTGTYIFLCPRTGSSGPMRLAITTGGGGGESLINAPDTLPSGWHHVAAVVQASGMQLYLDGEIVASGPTSVVPSDLGQTSSNWLGRSQYSADAYLNASLDDFRIYNYAMSAEQVADTMRGDPLLAWDPSPADGSTPDVDSALPLAWSPGDNASQHDVYFGTNETAVEDADASDTSGVYRGRQNGTSFSPAEGVEWGGGPYFWRIDQYNTDGSISTGRTWSFTVADFLLVDDFESYTDDDTAGEAIWQHWIDGFDVPANGSQVGNLLPPYAEQTIVHGGRQSMPLSYDNTAGVTDSQAVLTLASGRDWTRHNVGVLSLWFRGYPASVGSLAESPVGTFTMTGSGADIWGTADQFHFAYKMLTGPGTITARVESVQNTDGWAKAGVMIRETLEPGSKHAFACVTPGNGVASQGRTETDGGSFNTNQGGINAPHWVRLERDVAGNFTVSHSTNGSSWEFVQNAVPENIPMSAQVYIGLAVTAHNANATCRAVFSNVTITGNTTGSWTTQDVGIPGNDAEPLYIVLSNGAGAQAVVAHGDSNAATIDTWTQWRIDLSEFTNQGIGLSDVDKIAVGLGTGSGQAAAGGSGKVFIDDIRLYR